MCDGAAPRQKKRAWTRMSYLLVPLLILQAIFAVPLRSSAQSQPDLVAIEPPTLINDIDRIFTLSGTGFEATPVVAVGTQTLSEVTWLSAEQVQAVLPAGFAAGVYAVTLTNPGELSDTLPEALSVQNPPPLIEAVSPTSVPNDVNSNLVITGSLFIDPLMVQVAGQALDAVTVISPTRVEAVLPWGSDPGVFDLTVTNPGPGSPSATLTEALTVTQAFGVWTTNGPYGGNAIGLWAHPDDPDLVFVSMKDVGLFRSADAGANWQKVYPYETFIFAVAPSDHNLLYQSWVVLHKSTDGGLTWTPIYNEASKLLTGDARAFLVHPTDPNQLYVGIPDTNPVNPGFFYSADGGYTWERRENGLAHNSVAGAVFHPDNPEKIFLVTTDGYIYESTDSALNWIERGHPWEHFAGLAINPFGEHELWASVYRPEGDGLGGIATASLSTLGTWEINPFLEVNVWCDYSNVTFDTAVPGRIYISLCTAGLMTTDGGLGWYTCLSDCMQLMGFALSPADPDRVYARHMGKGVRRSDDGGITWTAVKNGLTGLVPTALAAAPDNPDQVYMGSNPYGLYRSDYGGHEWLELHEYMGSNSLAVDAFTPGRVYSTAFNGILVSTDYLQTWSIVPYSPDPPAWCGDTCLGGSQSTAVGSHPTIPGRVLAAIGFEFEMTPEMNWPGMIAISTDYGLTWNAAQTPEPCGAVLEFAFSLSDPNWIYANGYAYNHVELLRSRDGGFTWEDITPEFPIWGYTVAVNPTNPKIVFIAAYETIYRSTDGGESWMVVASYGDVRSMLYTPTNPPVLYAGGYNGLWRSLDDGLTWTLADGLLGDGSVIVRRLAFSQDAERSVVYVGVAGLVDTSLSIAQSLEDTQAAAGVYRNARLLPSVRLYLPFVQR